MTQTDNGHMSPDPNTPDTNGILPRARALESETCEDGKDGAGEQPSLNGSNGRDAGGKFVPGWKGGKGNPHAKRVNELKAAVMDAVSVDDVQAVIKKLVELSKDGDVAASKVFLDRIFGKEVVAHIEHSGDGQGFVLILPSNGTESGARARTSTAEGE